MASLNKCLFIGNLGADPELRVVGNTTVSNFSIACTEKWTKDGQTNERTEWVRVQAWGRQAEVCARYLKKGSQVFIEGRLQTREYEKDGQKRYATEIVATNVVFLGGGRPQQQQLQAQQTTYEPQAPADDAPF